MSKKKNILFVTTDQQRADTIGSQESYFTPNLNELVQRGIEFTNHICTSAQCAPSRASWMTGRCPHEVGVNVIGHKLDPNDENIAYEFNRGGYETVYFGKWHLGGKPSDYGFNVTNYRSEGADFWGANDDPGYWSNKDAVTTAQALNYLEDYKGEQSFFMHVSWYMPHPNNPKYFEKGPFEDVEAFSDRFDHVAMDAPKSFYQDDLSTKPEHQIKRALSGESKITEDVVKDDARKYHKLVSLMDYNLGKIMRKLEEKNLLDDTMIVFTSDHGDMQGAHRLRLKGVVPYKELYHVPLVAYIPWLISKRKKVSDLNSNASIAATLLDAADLSVPSSFYPSLLPLLQQEEEDEQSYVFIEHFKAYWGQHPFRGIQTKNYKYVYYYEDDVEEMYDLKADPDEMKNISQDTFYYSEKNRLREMVDVWWTKTGGLSKEPIIDPESNWGKKPQR